MSSRIESRGSVEGMTTAAGIWVTGATGMACGMGSYWLAVSGAAFALVILRGLGLLERWYVRRRRRGEDG
ncbi:MAG TPA: MgtC/SapB family protein [Methylomirabilota bacterium]|nr:MgtC/SapB family protein [Methylomirabilota bacterium]